MQQQPPKPLTRNRHDGLRFVILAIQRLLAVALTVVVIFAVWNFPIGRPVLAVALAVYAALLLRRPSLWLLCLPAILPLIDLAPWSGRFFLDEFDLFVLTTLAAISWRAGHRSEPGLVFVRADMLIFAIALSVALSTLIFLLPLQSAGANAFSSYLSSYNALRVAKGFAWAFLLLPHLRACMRSDPDRARQLFIWGILIGLGGVGLAFLWERGVLADIVHWRGVYAVAASLLDLSTDYRATGLFSAMHTGGTATDGYLGLAVPFALYPLFFARSAFWRLIGLALFALGTYAVVVTFSRGLYLGYGASVVAMLGLLVMRHLAGLRQHGRDILVASLAFAVVSAAVFLAFKFGGHQAIIVGLALAIAAAIGEYMLRNKWSEIRFGYLVVLVFAGIFGLYDGIIEFKWASTLPATAFVVAATVSIAVTAVSGYAARRVLNERNFTSSLAVIGFAAVLVATVIPALSGYRMEARISSSSRDIGTRQEHWRSVVALGDPSLRTRLFGMGSGSFPRAYYRQNLGKRPLVHYKYARDYTGSHLELEAGGFTMMQRVPLKPDRNYLFRLQARSTTEKAQVNARLCHKNILFSRNSISNCKRFRFRFAGNGEWHQFEQRLNSGTLGEHGIFYWPVTLLVSNARSGSAVDIKGIELFDPGGANLIRNGRFDNAGDHWFWASDFDHLAWHTKNVFLNVYFEQGIVGLALFMIALWLGAARQYRAVEEGDEFAIIIMGSLVGFFFIGLFGSMIDNPRIATLFYLILFMALDRSSGNGRQSGNVMAHS